VGSDCPGPLKMKYSFETLIKVLVTWSHITEEWTPSTEVSGTLFIKDLTLKIITAVFTQKPRTKLDAQSLLKTLIVVLH
jgi:hypothetical protein